MSSRDHPEGPLQPERVSSFATHTTRSDMWSVGIILFEIAQNRHPIPCRKSLFEMFLFISKGEVCHNTRPYVGLPDARASLVIHAGWPLERRNETMVQMDVSRTIHMRYPTLT